MTDYIYFALTIVAILGPVLLLRMITARLDRMGEDIKIVEGQLNEFSKAIVDQKAKLAYLSAVYSHEIGSELELFDQKLSAISQASGLADQAHDTKMLEGRKALLRKLKENLLALEAQKIDYGLHAPIELENNIQAHEHAIEKLLEQLEE